MMSAGKEQSHRVCSHESCPPANLGETAICFTCKLESHLKCYGLKKSEMKSVGGDCNLHFICDTCVSSYRPIGAQVATIVESVEKKVTQMHNGFNQLYNTSKSSNKQLAEQQKLISDQQNLLQQHHDNIKELIQQQQTQLTQFFDQGGENQRQANELLSGIHATLKENADASVASYTAFTQEIVNMKASINASSSIGNLLSPQVMSRRSGLRTPAASIAQQTPATELNGLQFVEVNRSRKEKPIGEKQIVVSQLHPSVSADQLIQYVVAKLSLCAERNGISARALIPKGTNAADLNFVSIMLTAPENLYGAIMDQSLWPQGARVRDFEIRPRTSRQSGVFLQL